VAELPGVVVRGTVDILDEDVPVGYLRALERTDQAEYRPLAELVARAEKGRLQAQRRATGWYSTKAWVDRYARSRRGPAAKTRGA